MSGILVDTNLLVYAHDRAEPDKQARAIATLSQLRATGNGRLSSQCLAEFFRVITRPAKMRLTLEQAAEQVADLAEGWRVWDVTAQVVREAVRGVRCHQFSYWDAQVWAVARLNQADAIFSEDFASGSSVEGVRFVNPLAADFKLAEWTGA